jgi:hypothetical protein
MDIAPSPYAVFRQMADAGRVDERRDAALPDDDALWALAVQIAPTRYPVGRPERAALGDLRDAYNDGRRPHQVNLHRLAALIRERGVDAFVESAGGGTALIAVGGTYIGADGQTHHTVTAGPGSYSGSTAIANRSDFCATRPETDETVRADAPMLRPDPERFESLGELADRIVTFATAESERHRQIAARYDDAVRAGWTAFWDATARELPETGTASALDDPDPREADEREITQARLLTHVRRFVLDTAPNGQLDPRPPAPPAVTGG